MSSLEHEFCIECDCLLTAFEESKGLCEGCEIEALRVFKAESEQRQSMDWNFDN